MSHFSFFKMACTISFYLLTSAVAADSYRQVDLQYRNAASVEAALSPLTKNKLAIAVDGNSLIISGAQNDVAQLASIIKKLDKPRKQFQVSLFRGRDPSLFVSNDSAVKFRDQRWSTNQGQENRIDTLMVEEGEMLIITEDEWQRLPIEQTAVVIANTTFPQTNSDLQNNLLVNARVFQQDYQNTNAMLIKKGVSLTAVLVKDKAGKEKISLKANYTIPQSQKNTTTERGYLSSSTTTVIELGQWQLLSSHQQLSKGVDANSSKGSRKQIVSTEKSGEKDDKVWVQFTLTY